MRTHHAHHTCYCLIVHCELRCIDNLLKINGLLTQCTSSMHKKMCAMQHTTLWCEWALMQVQARDLENLPSGSGIRKLFSFNIPQTYHIAPQTHR